MIHSQVIVMEHYMLDAYELRLAQSDYMVPVVIKKGKYPLAFAGISQCLQGFAHIREVMSVPCQHIVW